ncbi:MAG: hypothetical protein AAGJ18_28510 [Bacteroidota bacterium]
MSHIAIPIPPGSGKQDIEIEMTINGQKQQLHYRVEVFYWEDCEIPVVNRVECIKNMLSGYDEDWMIYFIGDPNEHYVPITFIKKEDWARKKQMMAASGS